MLIRKMSMRKLIIISIITLSGCASKPQPPVIIHNFGTMTYPTVDKQSPTEPSNKTYNILNGWHVNLDLIP